MRWSSDTVKSKKEHLPPFATISQVSQFFKLNEEQHAAFVIIAKSFLETLLSLETSCEPPSPPRMIIRGDALEIRKFLMLYMH